MRCEASEAPVVLQRNELHKPLFLMYALVYSCNYYHDLQPASLVALSVVCILVSPSHKRPFVSSLTLPSQYSCVYGHYSFKDIHRINGSCSIWLDVHKENSLSLSFYFDTCRGAPLHSSVRCVVFSMWKCV